MNYLETGLPHTEFFPRKTDFRPPRYMPLCSLGRKYLGLEPLRRDELESIISRLTRPKRKPEPEINEKDSLEPEVTANPTRRFVGRKRMSSLEIEKMVERLYGRRQTKDFEFVDNTFETSDFVNMNNRDSDDESDDAFVTGNLDSVEQKATVHREQTLGMNADSTPCQTIPKHKTEITEIGEAVFKQGYPKKDKNRRRDVFDDRREVGKRDMVVDRLAQDTGSNPALTNIKRDATSPKQTFQSNNNSNSYQINRNFSDNYHVTNRNIPHTQATSPENNRRVPRLIKTAEPWSRRTEVVSRQIVNQVRRPHSNFQPETTSRTYRVLNIRPARTSRPEYSRPRCDTDLPSIGAKSPTNVGQPNNSQPPSDDSFIEQVASSNSPRTR